MAISAKVTTAINGLRKPFMSYAAKFGELTEARKDFAPKLMKVFGAWMQDTGSNRFVQFVRLLDPTIPMDREGYRAHHSYMAADYLRRASGRKDTGTNRAKPVRSNLAIMARLLATIQPLSLDPAALWEGVKREFALTDRQVTKLQQVVAASQPLIRIPNVKPFRVKIVHVPHDEAVAAARTVTRSTRAAA